jgi:hypothetical protein
MDVEGVSNCVIRNNLVYGCQTHGITVHSQDQANTPRTHDCTFVNNTVIVGNSNIRSCIQFQAADTEGMTVFNNILLNTGNGTCINLVAAASPTFKCDRNIVNDRFSVNAGRTIIPLASWRTATGADANSLNASPQKLFADAASGNYRLKAGSPAVGFGRATFNGRAAPSADLKGIARGDVVDAGAFEFKAGNAGAAPQPAPGKK